jgi:hypothetical protein
MDEVCGFWLSSGQNPGQRVQIVLAGRLRLTRTRKGQGFRSLRLVDGIYIYQLTADVGPLKEGGRVKKD